MSLMRSSSTNSAHIHEFHELLTHELRQADEEDELRAGAFHTVSEVDEILACKLHEVSERLASELCEAGELHEVDKLRDGKLHEADGLRTRNPMRLRSTRPRTLRSR